MNIKILFMLILLQPVRESISKLNVLPNVSMNITKFVSNGKDYDTKKFPYLVFISFQDLKVNKSGACTGSLLSKYFILTAAHCTIEYEDRISIIKVYYLQYDYLNSGQSYQCEKAYTHPDYVTDKDSDLGLLKLKDPINKAHTFARIGGYPGDFIKGLSCTIIGFGLTGKKGIPEKMYRGQMADVTVYYNDDKHCFEGIPKKPFKNKKHLCVKIGKKGTCGGDSGGPMICNKCQYGVCSSDSLFDKDLINNKTLSCDSDKKQCKHIFVYMFKDWVKEITGISEYCGNPQKKKGKKKKKKKNCGIIPNHELYYVVVFIVTVHNVFLK
ncbi:Myotoxin/Anenome neurotoxin domain,Peptidase S1A, chymotrypsin family,Serine proteases, trypsin family [Cinara cedri]|uniref:Myotoxin/Anenome neurotoxin domain,Peptidase S1A, chymotrypsin family,Serine proteases, trypsin family n=1 Tax=Cinara cedri TaxID=506608 RepID=A0A5E4MZB7_9HEMI|nr:Myotoxin/Anenome neurotoxin domain,Peptidase S1A, chymotrypsin family,Serine proteases, trypsin family [Cinara cedri]